MEILNKPLVFLLKVGLGLSPLILLLGILVFDAAFAKGDYYGRSIGRERPPFEFSDHTGKTVGLKDFEGKLVYLFFGFTRCKTACPRAMGRLAALDGASHDEDLVILFVTLDPGHDRGDVLKAFQSRFTKRVHTLWGSQQQLANTVSALDYRFEQFADEDISHEGKIFVLDRQGRPCLIYGERHTDVHEMLRDLNRLREGKVI